MSYREAMEQAGATIHEFAEFGSYQGEWYALVTWNGEKGWVNGSYGSCSGCDAFESEFGYEDDDDGCDEHRYHKRADCSACVEHGEKFRKHLAEFGKSYLETLLTQEQAEANAAKAAEWSMEDKEALDWLREHCIPNEKAEGLR